MPGPFQQGVFTILLRNNDNLPLCGTLCVSVEDSVCRHLNWRRFSAQNGLEWDLFGTSIKIFKEGCKC